MSPTSVRNRHWAFGVLVALATILGVMTTGGGQPAGGQGQAQPLDRGFTSAKDCSRCHTEGKDPTLANPDKPELVRLDEFKTWRERDKHSRAYYALAGDRGQEMGRRLRYDVTRESKCLSCHGTEYPRGTPPAESSEVFVRREEGVSCVACHGPYTNWVNQHGVTLKLREWWRSMKPGDKAERYGMTDLRDPATRARVCASCHIGKADEGKLITHEMYAAGHPPLPGIEVATFLEAMPPHWWKPADVPLFKTRPELRDNYHADPAEPPVTKAAVIGGVVALQESMRLLAAEAKPPGRNSPVQLDYARFECYACHHDLVAWNVPGWRQARGFGLRFDGRHLDGTPGRPRFRTWPLALARTALAQAVSLNDDAPLRVKLHDGLKDLHAAFQVRPFGEPTLFAQAAGRLVAWSEETLETLAKTRFDAAAPPRLLAALASLPPEEYPDYDSARQIAWALKAIYNEWRPDPRDHDPIAALLCDLDCTLKLDPYACQEDSSKLIRNSGANPDESEQAKLRQELFRLSEEELKTSLERAAGYDPVAFKKTLVRLLGLLSEEAPHPPPP